MYHKKQSSMHSRNLLLCTFSVDFGVIEGLQQDESVSAMPPIAGARRLPHQVSLDQPLGSLDTLFCFLCQCAFGLLVAVLQRQLFTRRLFLVVEGNIQPLISSLFLLNFLQPSTATLHLWDFSLQVSVMATKLQLPSRTEASNSSCILPILCAFKVIQLTKKVKMLWVFVNYLCDQFFPFYWVSDDSDSVTGKSCSSYI